MNLFVIGFSNDNVTFKAWYNIFFTSRRGAVHFVFFHSLKMSGTKLFYYAEDSNLLLWFWGTMKFQSILFKVYMYRYGLWNTPGTPITNLRPFIGAKPMCQNTIGSGQTSPSDYRIWRTHAWRNGMHAALVEVEHQIWLKMIFFYDFTRTSAPLGATFLDVFGCLDICRTI